MNNFYSSIIILLTAFFLVSCDSKETPVNELDDLIEEISENSKEYSDEEWEEATLQYQQIESDLEKHHSEYTDAELKEIGKKKVSVSLSSQNVLQRISKRIWRI